MHSNEKLEREVAALGDLSRQQLVDTWMKAHGSPPPKGVKYHLLELSAAWRLQARRLGGISAATKKALLRSLQTDNAGKNRRRGSEGAAAQASGPDHRLPLPSGTRLMREWNGRMHVVDVIEDGFVFDGKTYRSLSAIARRITGAQWSGPRFFGL